MEKDNERSKQDEEEEEDEAAEDFEHVALYVPTFSDSAIFRGGERLATIPSLGQLRLDDDDEYKQEEDGLAHKQEDIEYDNHKNNSNRIPVHVRGPSSVDESSVRGAFTPKKKTKSTRDSEYLPQATNNNDAFQGQHDGSAELVPPKNRLTAWLMKDAKYDHNGMPYFPTTTSTTNRSSWTLAAMVRRFLYDPVTPEFTSLHQFSWSIVIGIFMGIFTAVWKILVERSVEFTWQTIPMYLSGRVFTDVNGWFPMYHYMWIVPTVLGAVLSYIFVVWPYKLPDQNVWIYSIHRTGVLPDPSFRRTLAPLFVLSTFGMMSGLSLGPELPLVLTSGLMASQLALTCRQSIMSARVLNLTAASAAIGGFFGLPMSGAMFVLELPHRFGIQYFEALTPAIMSSIVAVVVNRMIMNNDVAGYFKYPFLNTSLPSSIFWHAIVYGVFGCAVGSGYLVSVKWIKTWVHDWFHVPHDDEDDDENDDDGEYEHINEHTKDDNSHYESIEAGETSTLLVSSSSTSKNAPQLTTKGHVQSSLKRLYSFGCWIIPEESHRAAAAGALAGFLCGWIAIFVPHTLFWGEAQLQNLIDKGRTALPVFEAETGDMLALGYCIIDPMDPAAISAGFSIGCSALLAVSKSLVIGLSLGTGIVGGHFWGPLFVGCAAGHFLSDVVNLVATWVLGDGKAVTYPCLVILCTMGAAHVVSFRANTAIMLILTLTISTFSPKDENPYYGMAGDYAAVFPLLVISVYISMKMSRNLVFYQEQQNRGDIIAVREVLCEPGAFNDDDDSSSTSHRNVGYSDDLSRTLRSSTIDDGSVSPPSLSGSTSFSNQVPTARTSDTTMMTKPAVVRETASVAYGTTEAPLHDLLPQQSWSSSKETTPANPENMTPAPFLLDQARAHRSSRSNSIASASDLE